MLYGFIVLICTSRSATIVKIKFNKKYCFKNTTESGLKLVTFPSIVFRPHIRNIFCEQHGLYVFRANDLEYVTCERSPEKTSALVMSSMTLFNYIFRVWK